MRLLINGKEVNSTDGLSVSEILVDQDIKMPDMVSVELNRQMLKRSDFETTTLKDGDQIEFLYFMGGGRGAN